VAIEDAITPIIKKPHAMMKYFAGLNPFPYTCILAMNTVIV
jgi:hypothetical protein